MRTSIATILATLGVFSCGIIGFDSAAIAASVSVGRVSSMTSGIAPFSEPRYNLGPGNSPGSIANDASADSCLRICMAESPGAPRRTRQSCRKSCAHSEF
jgi:hypothetical protein